jgi:hypothetical protein
MTKTFYTDHEIEDLAARGVTTLEVNDDVVLTDLAREKARRLGLQLVIQHDKPPSAPERLYIAAQPSPSAAPKPAASPASKQEALHKRVHAAVVARLGEGVDAKLLDTIIRRVLNDIGAK